MKGIVKYKGLEIVITSKTSALVRDMGEVVFSGSFADCKSWIEIQWENASQALYQKREYEEQNKIPAFKGDGMDHKPEEIPPVKS